MIKIKNFFWSSTKVNVADYCTVRFLLRYVYKEKPLRLSTYVKGSLYHSLIEHFWDRLGEPKEIKRNKKGQITSKKKYFNAQNFVEYAQGKWISIIIADQKAEDKITWGYENEKWDIYHRQIPLTCAPLFDRLVEEGPPEFSELEFDFYLSGERFKGRLDEVRKRNGKVVIRDYKTGKIRVGEMKLKNDPQLTLYNVGLCGLCKTNPEIRERLGIEKSLADSFMGNPIFVYPEFEEEFFMIDVLPIIAKSREPEPKRSNFDSDKDYYITLGRWQESRPKHIPNVVEVTSRSQEDLDEVLTMIFGIKKIMNEVATNSRTIYAKRGAKCDFCDMRYACNERLKRGEFKYIFKDGQQFFNFAVPTPIRKENKIRKSKKLK